jgi:hypothetical protein
MKSLKYLSISLILVGSSAFGASQLQYNCSHPNVKYLQVAKSACDLLAAGISLNDYDAMVQLASTAGSYTGTSGIVSFYDILTSSNSANVALAIGNNASDGVNLQYSYSHPTAKNASASKMSCSLLKLAAFGSEAAADSVVQLCSTGNNKSFCDILQSNSGNSNVLAAINANSNGQGVQLGYSCSHSTAKNANASKVACSLLEMGGLSGLNVATSLVNLCSSGVSYSMNPCLILGNNKSNANVQAAIVANAKKGLNYIL